MEVRHRRRFRSLSGSLVAMLCGGTIYAWSVYSSSLSDSLFGTSDPHAATKTAALYQAVLTGNYLPFAGLFYDRFGARKTIGVGVVLNLIGYGVLWAIATNTIAIGDSDRKFAALIVTCGIAGHSSGYFDASALCSATQNFPRHRGRAVGLLKSLYGLSAGVFTLIYVAGFEGNTLTFVLCLAICGSALGLAVLPVLERVLLPGDDEGPGEDGDEDGGDDEEADTLRRFHDGIILVVVVGSIVFAGSISAVANGGVPLSVTFAAASVAIAVLLALRVNGTVSLAKVAPPSSGQQKRGHSGFKQLITTAPSSAVVGSTQQVVKVQQFRAIETVRRPAFWVLFFVLVMGMGSGLAVLGNAQLLVDEQRQLAASDNDRTTTRSVLVALLSVMNCFGRLFAGAASDRFSNSTPRPWFLLASLVFMGAAQLLLAFSGDGHAKASSAQLYIGGSMVGFSYGMLWTLCPAVVSDLFGTEHFGQNYALIAFAPTAGSLLGSTWLVPSVWEAHQNVQMVGDDDDYVKCDAGAACLRTAFLVLAAACFTAAALTALLLRITRETYKPAAPRPADQEVRLLPDI